MKTLRVRSIVLEPILEADLSQLFEWRNDEEFRLLCSTRRNTISFAEFTQELARDMERDRRNQYMIRRNGETVGTIYAYNLNQTDGHAFVTLFLDRKARKRGIGAVSIVLFATHLFEVFSLHKIYLEVYSYNASSLANLRRAKIFEEEGIFKEHRLVEGVRYDLVRFALFRRSLPKLTQFLNSLSH